MRYFSLYISKNAHSSRSDAELSKRKRFSLAFRRRSIYVTLPIFAPFGPGGMYIRIARCLCKHYLIALLLPRFRALASEVSLYHRTSNELYDHEVGYIAERRFLLMMMPKIRCRCHERFISLYLHDARLQLCPLSAAVSPAFNFGDGGFRRVGHFLSIRFRRRLRTRARRLYLSSTSLLAREIIAPFAPLELSPDARDAATIL